MKRVSFVLVALQVFDIAIHVATNQAEPVRITANFFLIAWAVLLNAKGFSPPFQSGLLLTAGYLVLNLVFLSRAGLTNPNQGGELRVMLLALMLLSLLLSGLLLNRQRKAG